MMHGFLWRNKFHSLSKIGILTLMAKFQTHFLKSLIINLHYCPVKFFLTTIPT